MASSEVKRPKPNAVTRALKTWKDLPPARRASVLTLLKQTLQSAEICEIAALTMEDRIDYRQEAATLRAAIAVLQGVARV